MLSVSMHVELLLQCYCTLPLHRALAECSHSGGISSSFKLNGWKQASALTVAPRTLNPQLSAHFQLTGKKLILMRSGPPGPQWAHLKWPCGAPLVQSPAAFLSLLATLPAPQSVLGCYTQTHRLSGGKSQRHSHLLQPWNWWDSGDLEVPGYSPNLLCWWTGTSPSP